MSLYAKKPWLSSLIAKTIISESCREDNKAGIAFIQSFSICDGALEADDVVACGLIADGDVTIKGLFSRECMERFEEEEKGIDFLTDLKYAIIIVKEYKVLPVLESSKKTCLFALYINHITPWTLNQHQLYQGNLPNVSEYITIDQEDMAELFRHSAASKNGLSQLIEYAQEDSHVSLEQNVSVVERKHSLNCPAYGDISKPIALQHRLPECLNYKDCDILPCQLKTLEGLTAWTSSYQPDLLHQVTNSAQDNEESMEVVDELLTLTECNVPINPSDYLDEYSFGEHSHNMSDVCKTKSQETSMNCSTAQIEERGCNTNKHTRPAPSKPCGQKQVVKSKMSQKTPQNTVTSKRTRTIASDETAKKARLKIRGQLLALELDVSWVKNYFRHLDV